MADFNFPYKLNDKVGMMLHEKRNLDAIPWPL